MMFYFIFLRQLIMVHLILQSKQLIVKRSIFQKMGLVNWRMKYSKERYFDYTSDIGDD